MRFDVVVGNPPYNKDRYIDFVLKGFELSSNYTLMITPAKWHGKNSDGNELVRKTIVPCMSDVVFYPNTHDIFSILSDGGLSIFLCRKEIQESTNIHNVSNEVKLLRSDMRVSNNVLEEPLLNIGKYIFDKVKTKNFTSYNPEPYPEAGYNIYLTSQFGGTGAPTNRFFTKDENALVISKYELCQMGSYPSSGTTLLIYSSDNKVDCDYFLSWLYSKFIRFMLFLGICYRSSSNKENWRFVPTPDAFDHMFTDSEFYAKYKLTADEINIIESVIRGR